MPEHIPILVVEDNEDDSFLLIRQLALAQLDPFCAVLGDGLQAYEFLLDATTPPKVIFLDLRLPGINGIELLRRIREHPRLHYITVIIMTGSLSPADVRQCSELGVTNYLPKPIDLVTFMSIVGKYASASAFSDTTSLARISCEVVGMSVKDPS